MGVEILNEVLRHAQQVLYNSGIASTLNISFLEINDPIEVAHACNLPLRDQDQADLCELEVSLVYILSFRMARVNRETLSQWNE